MKKKIISAIIAFCMVAAASPVTSLAATSNVGTKDELVSAVESSSADTVCLSSDIEIDASLVVSREVTLDLNGYVLKMSSDKSVIRVSPTGKLVLKDSRKNTIHKFTPDSNGQWLPDEAHGTKTVNGGIITGDTQHKSAGGGVCIEANETDAGSFIMEGGNIVGCTAREGGGVYIDSYYSFSSGNQTNATFKMSGGSIIGCVAACVHDDTRGGGICNFGNLELTGSATIKECRALYCDYNNTGGGILSVRNITIADNATISDCVADGVRDAMSIDTDVTGFANITGGSIYGNAQLDLMDGRNNLSESKFYGDVRSVGAISGGIFYGDFYNSGVIKGGTFHGNVIDWGGTIDDSAKRTVTFDTAGGSAVTAQTVLKGQTVTEPTATKENYIMTGWYNGTTAYNFSDPVMDNITLTAKWINTLPVIEGITDGATYCGAKTVTVKDNNIDTVTVNGVEITLDSEGKFTLSPASGEQKIVVTDADGNRAEATVTINDGHTPVADGDCTAELHCKYCGVNLVAAESHSFGEWTDNDDGTRSRHCTVEGCNAVETEDIAPTQPDNKNTDSDTDTKQKSTNKKKAVNQSDSTTSPKTGNGGATAAALGVAMTAMGMLLLTLTKKKKTE